MTNFLTGLSSSKKIMGRHLYRHCGVGLSLSLSTFANDANAKWSKGASMRRTVSPQYFLDQIIRC